MIIAAILFMIGMIIGLNRYIIAAILAASAIVTLVFWPLWFIRDEVDLIKVPIWLGYLFALQAGYFTGAYIAARRED